MGGWYTLNLYDTKVVICKNCGSSIGEIDYNAMVMSPKCGICIENPKRTKKVFQEKNDYEF